MSVFCYISPSAAATEEGGRILGAEIKKSKWHGPGALFIGLSGELGGGKTIFAKGVARGLGVKSIIQSPTFLLMKRYPLRASFFKNFWHVDCYRIDNPKELDAIGFKKIAKDPKNIILVEWADHLGSRIPRGAIRITFEHAGPHTRRLILRT